MENLLRDLRYALRTLLRSPGFTLTAVLSLALGLGATTAIFSVVDGVLLRPPPYPEADRLAVVWSAFPTRKVPRLPTSLPTFRDLQKLNQSFESMAAWAYTDLNLAGGDSPERVRAITVAGDLLRVLRVQPLLGRGFGEEEMVHGRHRVALISQALWRRRFGADPAILGKSMLLDAQDYTIIGVLPSSLEYPSTAIHVWVPLAPEPGSRFESRRANFLEVLGRLKPPVTVEAASKELGLVAGRLVEQDPEAQGLGASAVSLRAHRAGDYRMGLLVTLGAVIFVLLIACANVANLLLARGARRQRELAIRAALGATRGRLVRQLLTESVLLSLLGGAVGVGLAYLGVGGVRSMVPPQVGVLDAVGVDGRVLAFAAALSLVTGLLFGTLPALNASRLTLVESLKESAPTTPSTGGAWLRGLLVSVEVALALVLLVAGGLLFYSLRKTLAVDLGFQPDRVLTVGVALPEEKYKDPQQASAFFRDLLQRTSKMPGVEKVGATSSIPMSGMFFRMPITVEGPPESGQQATGQPPMAEIRTVEGDYFEAIRASLLKGRAFGPEDGPGTVPVAVVNEAAVREIFRGKEALGERILIGFPESSMTPAQLAKYPGGRIPRFTVVGVLRDIRSQGPRSPARPEVFVLQSQHQDARPSMVLTVRSSAEPAALVPLLLGAVQELDPDQALSKARRMEEWVEESLVMPRLLTSLLTTFAAIALALATVGVGGVVGYSVSQRMREFGIRRALGATGGHIFGQILKVAGSWVGLGVLLGLGGAVAITRVLRGMLFQVSALDPLVFATVLLSLAAASLVALYLPGRRALAVDPSTCLRME
jgi:putative ABC transport system permease protein